MTEGKRATERIGGSPYAKGWHPPTTTGWQPTCTCNAAKTPCTVLDPFLGSGTTAAVAQANGCHCIGIELSAEYLELAKKRFTQRRLF